MSWNDRLTVCFKYGALHVIQVEICMSRCSLFLSFYVIWLRQRAVKECEAPVYSVLFVCYYLGHSCNFNSHAKLA